jgi:hypothetical protein
MSEDKKPHKIEFFIDKQHFETEQTSLTVRALLVDFAKEDPTTTTLALKHGNDITKFPDFDHVIQMENGMKFIVYHNTPTTVS